MHYCETRILKNGQPCILRNAVREDGAEVVALFTQTHEETDYLACYADEGSYTPEQEAEFLAGLAENARDVMLLAVIDGRIVGLASVMAVGPKCKVRHRAELGITVEKASWGLGIGHALMEACLACARQASFEQLELDVVAENERALALYESMGFQEFGRNPRGFRSRTGVDQPLVYMYLDLR